MKLAIKKERAIKLFKVLGFKTADTWSDTQLQKKIKNLPELADGVDIKNPKVKKLLKKILKADSVRIKSDEESKEKLETTMSKKKKTETSKKAKKQSKEVETKKKETKKKETKKTVKKNKVKKVGVITSILEIIQNSGPISKEQILTKLIKRFPDRDEVGMTKTISAQVPNRLSKEKKVKIQKNNKGKYFIK